MQRYSHGGGFRCFCGRCGTRLFNGLTSGSGFISLMISTLDVDPHRGPVMHINVESMAPWYAINDELPQHQGVPAEVTTALKTMGRT